MASMVINISVDMPKKNQLDYWLMALAVIFNWRWLFNKVMNPRIALMKSEVDGASNIQD